MNDKEKAIEEMAKCYKCESYLYRGDVRNCQYLRDGKMCERYKIAEDIYNAGYRKIPDGAVVLSGREFNERWIDLLTEFDEMGFEPTTLPPKDMSVEEYTAFYKDKLLMCLAKARKETAREFEEKLNILINNNEDFNRGVFGWSTEEIKTLTNELAKQFGCEINGD